MTRIHMVISPEIVARGTYAAARSIHRLDVLAGLRRNWAWGDLPPLGRMSASGLGANRNVTPSSDQSPPGLRVCRRQLRSKVESFSSLRMHMLRQPALASRAAPIVRYWPLAHISDCSAHVCF